MFKNVSKMHLKAILAEEGVQNIREKIAFEVKTLKRMAFAKYLKKRIEQTT